MLSQSKLLQESEGRTDDAGESLFYVLSDDDEAKEAVSWYDMNIQKLPQCPQKCINQNSNYVEK